MIFTENNKAQFKRWEADIQWMQYLISCVRFDTSEEKAYERLRELRGKAERLEKELSEFPTGTVQQSNDRESERGSEG